MAERLATMRLARVRSPVPDRPTISAEKWHFSVTLRPGARSQALQLRLQMSKKNEVAKVKVFPHLEAWVRVGH